MRRVVVTGIGVWSSIGTNVKEVLSSLQQGRSGIVAEPARLEYGLHSALVGDVPKPILKGMLDRKYRDFLSEEVEYAFMAAREAFEGAKIEEAYLKENEVGVLWGADGSVTQTLAMHQTMQTEKDSFMVSPKALYRWETSSASMNLSTIFHLKGINMSIGAACASSSHAIGIGKMLIQQGLQDTILVGGSCEVCKEGHALTDALEALSCNNDAPTQASRPFDKDRDGMVQSGGAAALVLEEYEHAKARGANILAEVVGYGFSSNGTDNISQPDADGEYRAMERALKDADLQPEDIDYVNAHATSTALGDIEEAKALTRLFGSKPWISSTKSMTGHENWMAGASEAVYSILMMQHGFVAPNINLEHVMDEAKDLKIVKETIYTDIHSVLSNSSGMGGTNSALIFKKI